MAENIYRFKKNSGSKKCHIIAYSFAGIDARAAISMYGAHKNVWSLTTLSTPHLGCRLIDLLHRYGHDEDMLVKMQTPFTLLGMNLKNVTEYCTKNMEAFNEVVQDHKDVSYYSFGSKKKDEELSDLLREAYEPLTGRELQNETDGIIMPDEAHWGQHLLTFDSDHFEVMGLNGRVNPRHVCNLVFDNLRVCEGTREL